MLAANPTTIPSQVALSCAAESMVIYVKILKESVNISQVLAQKAAFFAIFPLLVAKIIILMEFFAL
ncbi:MAG: hypothetical protein F6K14_09925 [Symploca sp. SIO2C1]|nr:hypothetical protein [Symploca sp. SIO2C1]